MEPTVIGRSNTAQVMWRPLRRRAVFSIALAVGVPLAISVAWVPVRSSLPNVDLALILVLAAAGLGMLGSRSAVGTFAVCSALWFEFFDTVPYERLSIARNPDLETTLVLVVVAAMVGELSSRVCRHRSFVMSEAEKLSSIRSVAELVASGEELAVVIDEVADALCALLRASSCAFSSEPATTTHLRLSRDGELAGMPKVADCGLGHVVDLPVTVQGEELGRFELSFAPDAIPPMDRRMVAVTLADNVGAAFLAQAPPPLPPDKEPSLRLRLYGGSRGAARAGGRTGPAQETSGVVSVAR